MKMEIVGYEHDPVSELLFSRSETHYLRSPPMTEKTERVDDRPDAVALSDDLDLSDLAASLSEEFAPPEEVSGPAAVAVEPRPVEPVTPDRVEAAPGAAPHEEFIELDDILEDSVFTGESLRSDWQTEPVVDLQTGEELPAPDLASADKDGDILDLSASGELVADEEGVFDLSAACLGEEEDGVLDLAAVSDGTEMVTPDLDLLVSGDVTKREEVLDLSETDILPDEEGLLDLTGALASPGGLESTPSDALFFEEGGLPDALPATGFEGMGAGAPVDAPLDAADDMTDILTPMGGGIPADRSDSAETFDDFAAMLGAKVAAKVPDAPVVSGMSRGEFEETLEKVVTRVFARQLDAVLVAVIEQTVSRELDALKTALFSTTEKVDDENG